MKTTTIIIATLLALQVNVLLAGNEISSPVNNDKPMVAVISLLPTTPREATFEEDATYDINRLAPVTPAEAQFGDEFKDMISVRNLIPVTPVTADFDDTNELLSIEPGFLAPVSPTEADFE
jgi:hypothetical protein